MTQTLHELHKRGLAVQATKFRAAFTQAFLHAEHTPTAAVQTFWDEFVKAHAVIYRGGAERMVA